MQRKYPVSQVQLNMTIHHPFEVRDQRICIQAKATIFSELRVKTNDYFIGPVLLNLPNFLFEKLNLTAVESTTIELTAHPKLKIRGRVVDYAGNWIKDDLKLHDN